MSTKQTQHKHHKQVKHHTEASRSHDPRREHDRKARTHTEDVYASSGGGRSVDTRWILGGIAVLLVASLTLLFMAGLIEW